MNFKISNQRLHLPTKVRVILLENLVIFKYMNFKISNQRLHLPTKVRVILLENLESEQLQNYIIFLFNSNLTYACQIWHQLEGLINKISTILNKAIIIINFKLKINPSRNLYQSNKILKLRDYIRLINYIYVCKTHSKRLSPIRIFTNIFEKANDTHNYVTRLSLQNSDKIT